MGLLTTARARNSQTVTILNHTWDGDADAGRTITGTATTAGVACSLFPGEPVTEVDASMRWTTSVHYRLHFNADPGVQPHDGITWVDPSGVTHNLVVIARARNVSGMGRTFEVFAVERN